MEHLVVMAAAGGWIGAAGTVVAYWWVSTLRITPDSTTFQGMNAASAALLALSAASSQSWPSTTVNLTWMLIGIAALLGAGRLRARPRPERPTAGPVAETGDREPGTPTARRATPRRSSVAPGCTTRSYRCRSTAAPRSRSHATNRS